MEITVHNAESETREILPSNHLQSCVQSITADDVFPSPVSFGPHDYNAQKITTGDSLQSLLYAAFVVRMG